MMIERLLIKDSLSFSEVMLNPAKGFNVFSGVSGSGKSVLMESILALFGLKDSNAQLIEGEILLNADLEQFGILSESNSVTFSVIKKDKTKYFINNQSSSKRRVREIFGDCVKYIHSHSTSELSKENLLNILDSMIISEDSKYGELLGEFRENFKELNLKKAEFAKIESDEKNIADLKEFTRFEIAQIEEIAPKIDEYDELMEFKKSLSKKEKIIEKIDAINHALEAFPAIISLLEMIEKNKPEFEENLNDIALLISDEREKLESLNEENIESVLNRLEKLGRLISKYGGISEALEQLELKKKNLEYYENISFNKRALENEIKELAQKIEEKSREISTARKNALIRFEELLKKYCEMLMLNEPKALLSDDELSALGRDKIEIFLGKSEIKSLSSGEFNRLKLIALCIEIAFKEASGIIILDEIDANLSGKESEGIAKILSMLSKSYQIFTISHQSHMPVLAEHHYLVRAGKNNKSEVVLLDENGKIEEIARMISGTNITNEAIMFAKERLKSAK